MSDEWVVEQCQKTAQRLNEVFPGSIDDLEEVRVVVRVRAWVLESPGYHTWILPQLPTSVGRILNSGCLFAPKTAPGFALKLAEVYDADGLILNIRCRESDYTNLATRLKDVSRGQVKIQQG